MTMRSASLPTPLSQNSFSPIVMKNSALRLFHLINLSPQSPINFPSRVLIAKYFASSPDADASSMNLSWCARDGKLGGPSHRVTSSSENHRKSASASDFS